MKILITQKELEQHTKSHALMYSRGVKGAAQLLTFLIALRGWAQDDKINGPCDHREVDVECTFDEDYCTVDTFKGPDFLRILFGEELPDFIRARIWEKCQEEAVEAHDQRRIDARDNEIISRG